MSGNKSQHKDRSITVRFNKDVVDVIEDLAEEYGVTKSDIIRLAADNSLSRHLDHVRYIDPEQGHLISHDIARLGNVMGDVVYNLRRLGANLDQLLHKVNSGRIEALQQSGNLITRKDIDMMLTRMEQIVKKVGDDLHVFQN